MSSYIVLTAVGPDRPGLVDEISAFLAKKVINIEDSRMAILGGEFAVILLASGDDAVIKGMEKDLKSLGKDTGLTISTRPTISPNKRKVVPSIPHKLHATSMDHPGIIHEITRILHNHVINIESMETHVSHAPITAAPIFTMHCRLSIPVDEKLSVVKKELEQLGDRLNIDIELEALETF
jgi:glycine cleavage system transcriptional repressor